MHRPSAATCIALVALFVALGGPAEAAKVISGSSIKKESITGKQIKARSVTLSDLSVGTRRALLATPLGSIDSARLRDGGVGPADLAPSAVGSVQLAENAVIGTNVVNNALTGEDIGPGAIGSDELADGSVRAGDIADNAVDGGEVVNGSIGSAELAADAVTAGQVADGRLSGKDLGRFTGTLELDFGVLSAGACATVASTSLTATNAATQNLTDDAIVLTPRTLADATSVVARPLGADQIRVTVCNHSGAAMTLGVQRFNFVTFDVNG